MELERRLERIERTKDISEIAEHVRWMLDEGVPDDKKVVVDRIVADAVWGAVTKDVNSLMTFGRVYPAMAVNQHGRRARYYERLEKLAKKVFGEQSATAEAARQAKSMYAGKIIGVGILGNVGLGVLEVARLKQMGELVKTLQPDVMSSHQIVKGAYAYGEMVGNPEITARGVIAAGLETKILRVPGWMIKGIDRSVEPKGYQLEGAAESIPRYYGKKVREARAHTPKETARSAIRTAEEIRRETTVVEQVVGERAKSWSQEALDKLYRMLRAMAKNRAEAGDVMGARQLMHAAIKVRGFHVREKT